MSGRWLLFCGACLAVLGCASPASLPQVQPAQPASADWQELFHQMDERADEIEIAALQAEISITCPSNLHVLSRGAREVKLGRECCNPALLKSEIKALERLRAEISIEHKDYLNVLKRLLGTWYLVERTEHMYCSEIKIPPSVTRGELSGWRERFNEHRSWMRRSREQTQSICLDVYARSPVDAQNLCSSSHFPSAAPP